MDIRTIRRGALDVVDPGTLRVLCQIKAIADHVATACAGFTLDDMRVVAWEMHKARLLIERAIEMRIEQSRWDDVTDGGAS